MKLRSTLCALSLAVLPLAADANPPRAPATRAQVLRARPRAAVAPVLAVQVLGVRAGSERPWGAVAHAIHRDVSTWLFSCYAAAGPLHATAQVDLAVDARGRVNVSSVTVGPRRNEVLTQCVERAARQLVLPPSDSDMPAESDTVGFEVRFGMPPMRAR